MKTKLSLITLFACAAAGTPLFADNENYDGQDLSGRDFSGSSMRYTSWVDSILTNADFTNSNLAQSCFRRATLTGAVFTDAVIHGDEEIRGATFIASGLTLAQLESTKSFKEGNLTKVELCNCDLSGGDFSGFVLTGVSFNQATLTNANFTGTNLTRVYLWEVSFSGADFTGANLSGVNLETCSSLTGAVFTDAVIHGNAGKTGALFFATDFTLSQLKSTKSFKDDKNLYGVSLNSIDLSGVDFSGFNLVGTRFAGKLTGADLTDAVIHGGAEISGADFYCSLGFTLSQLESTKSFKDDKNLSRVALGGIDLSGADFSGFTLSGTDFRNATLDGADFTDAVIHRTENYTGSTLVSTHADFTDTDLTLSQLKSTKSYKQKNLNYVCLSGLNLTGGDFRDFDLSGAKFRGSNLTNADFRGASASEESGGVDFYGVDFRNATLDGADFTDAVIHRTENYTGSTRVSTHTDFTDTDLTLSQLKSTKSYKQKKLTCVALSGLNLTGGDFRDFDLSGAIFRGSNLTNADFRGASASEESGGVRFYGVIGINRILIDGEISDFDVSSASATLRIRGHEISAKLVDSQMVGGTIVLESGATLDVNAGATMTLDGGEIRFETDGNEGGLVSVKQGGGIVLSDAARLVVEFTGSVSDDSEISILTWESGSTLSGLDSLIKGQNVFLKVNGEAYDEALWDFSTDGNALVITIGTGYEILIDTIDQIVNLPGAEYVGTFDSNLREFRGSISGGGAVHSGYDLTFSGDASAHTGTTHIDGGTFTIVDAATLGTSAFEVAGTLSLNGDRTFGNATSGDGVLEVASGATTFTRDVGTKTLSVKNGAEATLGSGVSLTHTDATADVSGTLNLQGDRTFSATLTGAGTLTTNGAVSFESNASGFSGVTKVESGTLKIADTATLGTGAFEVAGTLSLNGDRTFGNATSGDGVLEVASGTTTFTRDVGTKTFSVLNGAEATLGTGVSLTHADATADVSGTLNLQGNRTFSATLTGAGTLTTNGAVSFESNASGFSGVTKVESGTLKIADTATLGTGSFEVAGTLSLNGDRTFGNATIGDGVLEIASGTTTFTRDVGTRTINVKEGATAAFENGALFGFGFAAGDINAVIDGTLKLKANDIFACCISGSGNLETAGTFMLDGDLSGFSGEVKVTDGALTLTFAYLVGSALGICSFDVSGTLCLRGFRTFDNETNGDGTLEVAWGATTFTRDVGTKTFSVERDAEATFVDGIGFSRADATADVAGTLKLAGTRTFGAATYGSGLLELLSGADVKFSSPVGVRTLRVDAGATLNGGVRLTYGAGAALNLSGTLALNADAGEKVSLGGGRVSLASTATLDLYGAGGGRDAGTDAAATFASTSPISALSEGSLVTIFEGGTVSGDVVSFLSADSELSGFARDYAVVFDTANGLTVRIVRSVRADVSAVRMPSGWRKAFEALVADFALDLAPGFHDVRTLGNVGAAGSSDDPLISAILNDPEDARVMAMNILPGHYAAAVAMKAEGFHSDVRDVSARLEQRRWDGFSENGRFEFFAQGRGGFTENDDSDDSPTYDVNAWGVLVGGDYKTDSRTVVGLAVATEYDEAKIHDGGGKLRMTDTRLTGYFGKTFEERLYVNAGAQLGSARVEARRRSVWGDPKGETTVWNAGAFFEAGALIPLEGNFALMPYVGADYAHAWAESFREEGADAQWDVDSVECNSLRARVGCGASWQCVLDGERKLRVGVNAEYAHEFLGDEIDVDAKSLGGGRLPTITAKALPENVFSVGPTVNVDVSPSASVYAGYSFSAGTDSSTTHSANVGFRMRF